METNNNSNEQCCSRKKSKIYRQNEHTAVTRLHLSLGIRSLLNNIQRYDVYQKNTLSTTALLTNNFNYITVNISETSLKGIN